LLHLLALRIFLLGILIFKRLAARRLYKSFGVKGLMVRSTLPGRLTLGEVRGLVGSVWTIRSRKEKPLVPARNETNRTSNSQNSHLYSSHSIDPAIPARHPRTITTVRNVLPFGGCSANYAADVHRNVYRHLRKVHPTSG
jgi:hypothetical protein